ncbi:MAG: hydantoinase B/oxoprolinase family protein, partial [Paracoccaceae bacterium]|nr:hydantoinase B/oxoprolinase family protein [Paracoccaceae bacterium]
GAVYEIELLADQADLFLFGERGRHPPRGANGGGDAALNRFTYPLAGAQVAPPMTSKLHGARLARGDRIRLETPGGGGWGDPGLRTPEARARDLHLGYVTKG